MSFPAPHVQDALVQHTHTVIFLPGHRSTGDEFAEDFAELRTSAGLSLFEVLPNVRWVFPTPQLQYSSFFEEDMCEWFDAPLFSDISRDQHVQVEGLHMSVEYLRKVVEEEVALVGSPSKVALAGFSQGEATALHVLLSGVGKLGGFIGLSGWLPFADKVEAIQPCSVSAASRLLREKLELQVEVLDDTVETPVFLGHSTDDRHVDVSLGRKVRDLITGMRMDVTWKEYQGAKPEGHWFKEPEEVDDIVGFLKKQGFCYVV